MDTPELEHIKTVWMGMQGKSPIYDFLLGNQDLVFISASKGSFKAHLTLGINHVNSRKTIHGSVTATLVDWAGGLAIATHGLERTGASIDIHITYISPAHVGDKIQIEGTANKVGRSMGFTSVKLTKLVDGELGPIIATASHTKLEQMKASFKSERDNQDLVVGYRQYEYTKNGTEQVNVTSAVYCLAHGIVPNPIVLKGNMDRYLLCVWHETFTLHAWTHSGSEERLVLFSIALDARRRH